MKTCSKCKETKPFHQFYKQETSMDGHGSWCKPCQVSNRKKWRASNLEEAKDYEQKVRLAYKYGITLDEYNSLIEDCGNKCQICGKSPGDRRLSLDHCHDTGKIRGILCHQCNVGLGMFKDSKELLLKASEYL